MPGVPSGRGCDGCRKQKKKCDQGQPACSRGTRLQIGCIGSGLRRFKFVEEQSVVGPSNSKSKSKSPENTVTWCQLSFEPSNESTLIQVAFMSAIEIKDVRYDLSTYGAFLKCIPRRLGTNSALDAAVKAFTVSIPIIHNRKQTPTAIQSYIHALRMLRECLCDRSQASSANTLCAVYLIMVCQGWIGQRDDCMGHGEAIAALLSNLPPTFFEDNTDIFETDLVMTLCVPVIIESICNPKIVLYPWLPLLTKARDDAIAIESLRLRNLARLSDFMSDPRRHAFEIKSAYQRMGIDLPKLRAYVTELDDSSHKWNIARKGSRDMETLRVRLQAAFGLLLGFASILNALLRVLEPTNIYLWQEVAIMAEETIKTAEDAAQYRPLGSSAMPMSVATVWATTDDVAVRKRLEQILAICQPDFAMSRWLDIARWLEERIMSHVIPAVEVISRDCDNVDQSCAVM